MTDYNPDETVDVNELNFAYSGLTREDRSKTEVIRDLSFKLARGSRCVLIGSNGAGKSTLLRLLAGKHMVPKETIRVLGRPAFHDMSLNSRVAYLGDSMWKRDIPSAAYGASYTVDVPITKMIEGVSDIEAARARELIELLDIDMNWRLHKVSDGQRRRVQIMLKLLTPFEVLFLDEVTVDLDVIARADLLAYLRRETEERGVTIIYATHIFDGLDDWASHIAVMTEGTMKQCAPISEVADLVEAKKANVANPLLHVVMKWLRAERAQQIAAKNAQKQS